MTQSHPITNAADAATFALAGNATFTLRSKISGVRYTFHVEIPTNKHNGKPQDRWFVKLLTGPNNTEDYTYLGMIVPADKSRLVLTKASRLNEDAKPVQAINFFLRNVVTQDRVPDGIEIWHEGRCGKCNRELTVPESIERGIGPECAKKVFGRIASLGRLVA